MKKLFLHLDNFTITNSIQASISPEKAFNPKIIIDLYFIGIIES